VLLASGERLAGAVHVATKGCKAPLGKKGGVAFVRVEARATTTPTSTSSATSTSTPTPTASATPTATATAKKATPDSASRARAREIMRDGAAWLGEGSFEAARRRFLEAIELDGGIPEAFNGVGVTYRMRNDLPRALDWYKKALTVDPDFGDAYYNIACVYALEGHKELALRYLQIAAMNGYATAEGIDGDPDLEAVRDEPAYRALVRAKM
jgi:Tfp pilus assembly protein PilF